MQDSKSSTAKLQQLIDKSKGYQKSKRQLSCQVRDLWRSRSKWKSKYLSCRAELEATQKALEQARQCPSGLSSKPRGHQYSSFVICLALWLREYCNCSLRSCSKILEVVFRMLSLRLKVPSHVSICNWERKQGYYRLEGPREVKGKWLLILDESISIAQQRILLLLGCRLDQHHFDRPLGFGDVQVLSVSVDKSWTELCIGQRIRELQAKGYEFVHSVSDGGKAIIKSLQVNELNRIADCTHAIGGLLEKQYKKLELFQAFSKLCGQLKQALMNGQYAHWIPPTQRVKGRFLNLFELSHWAKRVIHIWQNQESDLMDQKIREKLAPLIPYQELIQQIDQQCTTIKQLFSILKTQGLNQVTKQACEQIVQSSNTPVFFKQGVQQYLDSNIQKEHTVVCCSDVIESCFGKYKNRMPKNKLVGFTLSCLTLANMRQNFTITEITQAMEHVKMKDLADWKSKNLYPDGLHKRKAILKL